jgi:hypothetical protein
MSLTNCLSSGRIYEREEGAVDSFGWKGGRGGAGRGPGLRNEQPKE